MDPIMTAGGLTAQDLQALRRAARAKRDAEARMMAAVVGYNMEVWDARRIREKERRRLRSQRARDALKAEEGAA